MTIIIDTSKLHLPTGNTLNKALASAINKTIVTAKKEMSSSVREVYNIKKKELDPNIKVSKAKMNNTTAIITIRSKPIGVIHFGATASKAFDKGQKRYFKTSAKILKKSRKKVMGRAFIGRGKDSNSWQVFRRATNKRLPIIKMSVISPTSMIKRKGIDDFMNVIKRDFDKKFQHEFEFFLSKQKGK